MFNYEWSLFNPRMGLIFMVGTTIVFGLMGQVEFDVMAAGISALLAWLTVILVPDRPWNQHVAGLAAYLLGGIAITWLANEMLAFETARLVVMGLVAFGAYMFLMRGAHVFIVAWCIVYWFLLAPLFLAAKGLPPILLAHASGAGLVLVLNLVKPVWSRATDSSTKVTAGEGEASVTAPPLRFVIRYAAVVGIAISTGLALGSRWLSTDPTIVANATLNMIAPSLQQTWIAAVERLVCGTIGIVVGFYLGWFFPDPWAGYAVTIACSFFLSRGVVYQPGTGDRHLVRYDLLSLGNDALGSRPHYRQ